MVALASPDPYVLNDLDYIATVTSLQKTKKPDFGLDADIILNDVNQILQKEKEYTITKDKLYVILKELEKLKCIEEQNKKWYLVDKIILAN